MKDSREDYIKYRISRAKESFQSAQALAEIGNWNSCINRLYYSCYYMVSALLLKHKIKTKTHSGLNTEFGRNFVKTGKVNKEHGDLFTDLMDWRYKGDYGDMFDFDEEKVKPLIPKIKKFLHDIEKLIKE